MRLLYLIVHTQEGAELQDLLYRNGGVINRKSQDAVFDVLFSLQWILAEKK